MVNYYSVLGVSEAASQAEIKAAFKRLAVKYHPDKHAGNPLMEERFKEVNQAYQVLSNAYEKARYDILLKYGHPAAQQSYYQPPPPPRPRRYKRPNYAEPEIDWRENWIATAYAFGFTLVMAILVMSVIGIKNYWDAKELKELLAERRRTFEQAKASYKMGEVDMALKKLNTLGAFMKEEEDMGDYKEHLYESFVYEGEHHYNRHRYTEAVYYFELIERYGPRCPLPIQEHLAVAYSKSNQPHKCIKKIKELLISGYRRMEMYLMMGQVYRDDLGDLHEARRYFEIASDLAIEKYKAIYGNAYPLVLEGKFLPEEHYHLYTGLAELYLQTGEAERAIKAIRWNVNIWPDSAANYVIAAKAYEASNNRAQACENYRVARDLGYHVPHTLPCQ